MTEFYCKSTPNGTASCGNIQSAPDSDNLICTVCGGNDWSPRDPAGSEAITSHMTIDITPVGCSTPEGAARVQNAMREFADATANVANEADQILDYHDQDDLGPQEWQVLRDLLAVRRVKQDALLNAVAGR
jgi:hypothetical protein